MKKTAAIVLTLVVAAFAIGVPVWLAIQESENQSLELETERALGYANDVLARSDSTADQVAAGVARLLKLQQDDPCADGNLALMRQIDLVSSYIQMIGYVVRDHLVCSSMGRDRPGILIGKPDVVTSNGVAIHKHLRFPFAPQQSFIALELKNYVAIIHKDLPIDVTTKEKDVSLAIFTLADTTPLTERGFIDPEWVRRLGNRSEITFIDGGHLVAVVKSKRYLSAAVAAIPVNYLTSRTQDTAMRLLPVGVFAGLALAACVLLLARTQMAIPSAIRAGLKRNEFFLLYQPIVDLKTGAWVGAEALIRWRRPGEEMMGPDVFIPLAEKSALIVQITQRVFELVAHDSGGFMQRHPGFHIAINLSAADLHSPVTARHLERLLEATGAAPGDLIVEMTERGLLDAEVARGVTRDIRAKGVCVAIDDFGTGYSSLSYLETLEVDYLKIDKSFIEAIGTGAPTSQVVPHIIDMAKGLKIRMIAEGVETEAQAQFLRERGVEFAQGWLFGRPMPFAKLAEQLSERKVTEVATVTERRAPAHVPDVL